MSSQLIVFAKNTVLGKVKTRLAASIGDEKALEVYKLLLHHTQSIIRPVNVDKLIYFSDSVDSSGAIWSNDLELKVQMGPDLGARMSHAFRSSFENGYDKVVIIGTDCPDLSSELLQDAFSQLTSSDFVIGPAKDGGYYLLGMRQYEPNLFRNKVYSTDKVLQELIGEIDKLGMKYALLKTLSDIDTIEDLQNSQLSIIEEFKEQNLS